MLRCGIPTSPRNVLKNSDFTKPINTNGFSSISSGVGTTIDCWNTWISGSGGKIELTSSGIKLTPPTNENIGIYQNIENYELNKIYTVVVYINDRPYVKTFQMGNWGVGTAFGPIYFYSIPTANVLLRINSTDSAVTIQKVALYEGCYTLNMLPEYQNISKHVEMLNCNIPLAPHNLLDNSDFRNPVNQRGIASGAVITGWDYFIDRWKARAEDCSVNFSGEGITVSTPIGQTLPKETVKNGMTVTAAAKWSDGTICVASGAIRRTNEWGSFSSATINGHYLYVSDEGNGNNACMTISEGTVVWAALYEGAYDASTLPAYQPKGYAAELAECQRYYRRGVQAVTIGKLYTAGGIFSLYFPQMRINPTINILEISSQGWGNVDASNYTQGWGDTYGSGHYMNFISSITEDVGKTIIIKYENSADL